LLAIGGHTQTGTHLGTEVTALHGDDHLPGVDPTRHSDDAVERRPCSGLFCFIGATPATDRLGNLCGPVHP
jgi:thioredoxin reductase (NADPH)